MMNNETSTLHNRLALFRAEAGLSRKELAEQVGVNPQTIGFLFCWVPGWGIGSSLTDADLINS